MSRKKISKLYVAMSLLTAPHLRGQAVEQFFQEGAKLVSSTIAKNSHIIPALALGSFGGVIYKRCPGRFFADELPQNSKDDSFKQLAAEAMDLRWGARNIPLGMFLAYGIGKVTGYTAWTNYALIATGVKLYQRDSWYGNIALYGGTPFLLAYKQHMSYRVAALCAFGLFLMGEGYKSFKEHEYNKELRRRLREKRARNAVLGRVPPLMPLSNVASYSSSNQDNQEDSVPDSNFGQGQGHSQQPSGSSQASRQHGSPHHKQPTTGYDHTDLRGSPNYDE